jgi:hypothetical protein
MSPLSEDSAEGSSHATAGLPEKTPLSLPSALPATLHKSYPFKIADIELRFRLAQAEDALSELRRLLRITMGLRNYKSTQIGPSQRVSTRARTLINRFWDKVSRCAERYRFAHSALLALDPEGAWRFRLRQLSEKDIQVPGHVDDESEGMRELSWIWRIARRSGLEGITSVKELDPLSNEDLNECRFIIQLLYCFVNLRVSRSTM